MEKVGKSEQRKQPRRGSTILLVGFILGIIFWLISLVPALFGIAIFAGTGLGTLIMLAPIPGLIGWVLTIIAYRKADRGESGLAWGVVGGFLMLFTIINGVPGILAIIGGALSRHPPETAKI